MATLGYVRSSNGPGLAQIGVNQQIVSHVKNNSMSETLRITSVSAWVGNWGGTATMRFGIWAASSSSAAPGALLARTVEFSPSVNYVDGAGGQLVTAHLEFPYELAPGQVIALGVASRNAQAGIAMFHAADPELSGTPNRDIYRKDISGTNLQAVGGSSSSYEGHLAIYVTGDTNQPPTAPTGLTPSGTVTGSLSPSMSLIHNDPNSSPSSQVRVQVQNASGTTTMWDRTLPFATNSGVRNGFTYAGVDLAFYTSYRWRAKTWDNRGLEGPWSEWTTFTIQHVNRNPDAPSNVDPPIGSVHGSRDITMRMDFDDPDLPVLADGQAWEQFAAKQVIVRRVSDNVSIFNTGVVTTTTWEKNNLRSSTAITLPAWDVWYRREERHRDRRGAWSPWVFANIRAVAGVSVEQPSQPSGRITNPDNLGIIMATYRHTGGLTGTRLRVGVFNEQGTLISQRETSMSVTNGQSIQTTFNALWGGDGFPFEDGVNYQYAVAARDSANNWSEWSPFQQLQINGAPNTPILYHPKQGAVTPDLPMTIVIVTDPDQPSTELTVTAEYYDADTDDLIDTVTLPNINGSTSFGYVPSDVITSYRNVYWRARAYDGYLYSPWSASFTFNWQPVPEVTVTAPAGPVITTSQPVFEWTATGQNAWRVRGYSGNTVVYDTGIQESSVQTHTIQSSSYWIGNERWNNTETFDWVVSVRDGSTQWGDAEPLTLTLEYIPPDPLIIQTSDAMALPNAEGTHYGLIEIGQSDVIEGEFLRYTGDRVEIDGPAGAEIPGTLISAYFVEGNSAETMFTDFDMTSGQWYRYTFRQVVQQGVDVIESEPVYAEIMASFYGTMIHLRFDPLNNYVWLPFGTERYEPEAEWIQGHSEVMTVSGRAPVGYSNGIDYVTWSLQSVLVPREGMTADQQRDTLRQLWKYQNKRYAPNGRPNSVCWRDGRGGDDGRVYGRISEARRVHSHHTLYTVELQFQELEELPVEGGAV